jgi:hypothetical protein
MNQDPNNYSTDYLCPSFKKKIKKDKENAKKALNKNK